MISILLDSSLLVNMVTDSVVPIIILCSFTLSKFLPMMFVKVYRLVGIIMIRYYNRSMFRIFLFPWQIILQSIVLSKLALTMRVFAHLLLVCLVVPALVPIIILLLYVRLFGRLVSISCMMLSNIVYLCRDIIDHSFIQILFFVSSVWCFPKK